MEFRQLNTNHQKGLPGFACDRCEARTRVLNQIDPVKAKTDPSYCHAAITQLANLEQAQGNGHNCQLKAMEKLYANLWGIPVASRVAKAIPALVLKLKNEVCFAQ